MDIETTGLSPQYSEITVVGIYICNGDNTEFIHLVGEDVTIENILGALQGVGVIYTYNGKSFDLPFIHSRVGVNLAEIFEHHDLMYDCWRNNLYGGFKSVERQLGIDRKLTEVDGYEAVRLWWRYVNDYDQDALSTLLEYNREDVVNLKTLKERLLQPSVDREIVGD
ncbi:ribonuclease H-like domain-containing protein [Chloroflexota bacterium]